MKDQKDGKIQKKTLQDSIKKENQEFITRADILTDQFVAESINPKTLHAGIKAIINDARKSTNFTAKDAQELSIAIEKLMEICNEKASDMMEKSSYLNIADKSVDNFYGVYGNAKSLKSDKSDNTK